MTLERPMFPPRRNWTDVEIALARELFSRNASENEFLIELGRTRTHARAKIYVLAAYPAVPHVAGTKPPIAPQALWDDASHRANAPRSLTSWICRDPAPGRSALDRRQEA